MQLCAADRRRLHLLGGWCTHLAVLVRIRALLVVMVVMVVMVLYC